MPLPYREFWHRPPTVRDRECGIPDSCGEVFSKVFWSPQQCGLDTRSLALAARPPESWRASSTSARSHPGEERHSAPYLLGGWMLGLDTRSLALAARPPVSSRW